MREREQERATRLLTQEHTHAEQKRSGRRRNRHTATERIKV